MRLNIGCGEFPASGWVNLDLHDGGPKPDVIGTVHDIPFPDDHFDRVYCGHILEHLPLADVPSALAEIRRVLRPDGGLLVVGPDLDRAKARWPEMVHDVIHGGHRWPGDQHHWESTETLTVELLETAGWTAKPLPVADVDPSWPVTARVGWQFAVAAR